MRPTLRGLARAALPATVLLSTAALLIVARSASGHAALGGELSLAQRDFRVYDNFTDPSAAGNVTADPSFPGQVGATLAIWKAVVEWGSELHGTGDGDPSQYGGLGSGGANFDATFQGQALGTGDSNDNVFSEISGSAPGILAYCETPISTGWRIRFYSNWTWEDGPGASVGFGKVDLQGVAAHEYGHALGLAHSTVSGCTMEATLGSTGVHLRSIEADDRAGVQSLYGPRAAGKPHIDGASLLAGTLTVTGSGFTLGLNEVWFTPSAAGGSGEPLKSLGASSDGTTLFVPFPATAGAGDLLVKRDGFGHADLSNAWPFDPAATSCPDPVRTCTAQPNSTGAAASLSHLGSTRLSDGYFSLVASGLPANQTGVFFYGGAGISQPFGAGTLCVAPGQQGLYRLNPPAVAGSTGVASRVVDFHSAPAGSGPGRIDPGSVWHFQYWYRDPVQGFNLSDALAVSFCP